MPFNDKFSLDLALSDLTELTYEWKKLSCPGDIIISDKTAQIPTIAASADGEYELELTITDELGYRLNHTIPFSWKQSVIDNTGNSASDSLTYTYDTTPPSAPSAVTITTSSPSGQTSMDISFTDGTDSG